MIIKSADYIISSVDYTKCPKPEKPEFAFIGRSNVGKSSLINMLINRKNLARISSTPGKTQTINHFLINNEWYLVDLPGLGYAKTSKGNRLKWEQMIFDYLQNRKNLFQIFVLIDVRIPPQKIDTDFMQWLGISNIPFALVFTKSDKVSNTALLKNIENYKTHLLDSWEELPSNFVSSSETTLGRDDILNHIEHTIKTISPLFNKSL